MTTKHKTPKKTSNGPIFIDASFVANRADPQFRQAFLDRLASRQLYVIPQAQPGIFADHYVAPAGCEMPPATWPYTAEQLNCTGKRVRESSTRISALLDSWKD